MKPEIKTRWLEALRSGRYKQGRSALRTSNNEFCCLGVLCDIVRDQVGGRWEAESDACAFVVGTETRGDSSAFFLPPSVAAFAGIAGIADSMDFGSGTVRPGVQLPPDHPMAGNARKDGSVTLDRLNDGGLSFAQIADVIESHLPATGGAK